LLLDSPSDTDRYRKALDRLERAALNADQSRTLIADQADHFDAQPVDHRAESPALTADQVTDERDTLL
jgi:hypothetical protein